MGYTGLESKCDIPALKVNGMYTGLESKWDIPALKVNGIYRP